LLSIAKIFVCSKLEKRVEISRLFTRFFAKNVCWTGANTLVLVVRFLWSPPAAVLHSLLNKSQSDFPCQKSVATKNAQRDTSHNWAHYKLGPPALFENCLRSKVAFVRKLLLYKNCFFQKLLLFEKYF
jgi:hypothetical protein